MTDVPWTEVVPLGDHDLSGFRSGRPTVDDWFHQNAHGARQRVATQLCLDDSGSICGFFALSNVQVEFVNPESLPSRVRRTADGTGRSIGVLLAQMGLDLSLQGKGLGLQLFLRAAREAAICSAVARVPLLVVDAADEELVSFYADKCGMTRLQVDDRRLVAPLGKFRAD